MRLLFIQNMANLLSGLNNLSTYLKNQAFPIALKAGQTADTIKNIPTKVSTAVQNLPNLEQAAYSTGKALGRGASHLPSTTGFLQGYIPIAALGQAALDYGTYRGSQMDSDPAVKQQMSDIQNAVSNGWVPMDDGTFFNLATNELSTYDQLKNSLSNSSNNSSEVIDHRNGETYPTLYGSKEMTPNERSARMSAASLVDIPESTITTPEPQLVTKNGVDITPEPKRTITTQNKSTGSSGSKQTTDKPQTENQISGFNALIPLLALGGLGYFMARR